MNSRCLTVYIRNHCHLCEQLVHALEPWRQGYDLNLDLVDVDEDPVLAARFGERVPVLAAGDEIIAEFFLDEGALRRYLQIDEAASELRSASVYARIYAIVHQIPPAKVATYGQIAKIEGRATARMVGYAMAALSAEDNVPWQRVINARGEISERTGGGGTSRQRIGLDAEGVFFNARGRVDFSRAGWDGPSAAWCATHGFHLLPAAKTDAAASSGQGTSRPPSAQAPARSPGRRVL
jgi:methylated-DNA-protein-cysteine methyltransferase-like protein